MPLALAILISFLLAPIVRWLEHRRCGRITSVILVTLFAFGVITGIGVVVGNQVIDLADKLPGYKDELHHKIIAIRAPKDGAIAKATETLKDLSRDFSEEPEKTGKAPTGSTLAEVGVSAGSTPSAPSQISTSPVTDSSAAKKPDVVPVSIVTSRNAFESLLDMAAPVLAPLGTALIVAVFVIFMLLGREDLRDRLIHLIGRGHLQTTTRALDEAGHRVSRYLLAQLIVNASYGIPVGVGMYFIGIPNAPLWGLLATVLRFIPYIGAWISSAFPLVLSLAIAPGWSMPAMTLGLFLVVELLTSNILEPWLYGTSTGISPLAVIVAAAFWTWLWGMTGLLLATPLTVCLVVLGKYIPSLSFMDVLLGDRPPIAPEDRFYQRLLASDEDEVAEIAEKHLEKHSLGESFDELIIPGHSTGRRRFPPRIHHRCPPYPDAGAGQPRHQ